MIVLYKRGATGLTGRLLARLLGARAWSGDSMRDKKGISAAMKDGIVIRWGNDQPLSTKASKEINARGSVALARNKRDALNVMALGGVRVPEFVTSIAPKEGAIGRTIYHQSGEGLRVFAPGATLRGCAYYLRIVPSIDEFRVHVVGGKIVATQRKVIGDVRQHANAPNADIVRNYDNGWRFVRIAERRWLNRHALPAIKALALDFGAVDILRSRDHSMYVLEVNTAPGLDGTMPERYAEALKTLCQA